MRGLQAHRIQSSAKCSPFTVEEQKRPKYAATFREAKDKLGLQLQSFCQSIAAHSLPLYQVYGEKWARPPKTNEPASFLFIRHSALYYSIDATLSGNKNCCSAAVVSKFGKPTTGERATFKVA